MVKKSSFHNLPIREIELDYQNPRIAKYIEMYGGPPTAEQIHLALGAGDSQTAESDSTTFYSLRESIKTYSGIIHPIIVNQVAAKKYTAIEGNTRVLIYREFKEQGVPGSWDTIPAMVYKNLGKQQIDAIRLQAHLVGPRQWDPYSKAKYLHRLRNEENLTFNQIVDYCGGRKKEVINYIDAYMDMEKYYRKVIPDESQFDTTRFSAFVEVQKPSIKEGLLKANFTMEDFARWVDERLIHPLETVRKLPQILSNPESKGIFLKDGAREAMKVLIAPPSIDLKQLSLEQLVQVVYERLSQIKFSEIKEMRENIDSPKAQALIDLRDELVETCKEIQQEED